MITTTIATPAYASALPTGIRVAVPAALHDGMRLPTGTTFGRERFGMAGVVSAAAGAVRLDAVVTDVPAGTDVPAATAVPNTKQDRPPRGVPR